MLVLDEALHPVDRIAPHLLSKVERERSATVVHLFGRLVAYLPHNRRAYYDWAMVVSYRPAQHISVYQFSPAHLRIVLFSKWEMGLILGSWLLGLRLGQPLAWFKRVQAI